MISFIRDGLSSELWVIFGFMLLVLVVCVYDFWSTSSWVQPESSDRNEEVFENRNKMYGAYSLRKNSSKNMLLILASVLFTLGSLAGVFVAFRAPDVKKVAGNKARATEMFTPDEQEEEKIEEPLEPEVPEEQKAIQFIPPRVEDDVVETEIPDQTELEDNSAGSETGNGNAFNTDPDPGTGDVVVEVKKPDPVIYDIVDEAAEYTGGANAYIGRVLVYPPTAVEQELEGRCFLKFVVSDKGTVSNVKVVRGVPDCPECDEAAIKAVESMGKWTPAKVNGQAVNSKFSLPVTFKLN